jgi:hypothetical protein
MRVTDSGGFGSRLGLTGFGGFGRNLKPEYQMSPDVPIPCPTSPCELGKSLKLLRIVVGTLGRVLDEGWCPTVFARTSAALASRVARQGQAIHRALLDRGE